MIKTIRFCYEIAAEAGYAKDEDGNDAECYIQMTMNINNDQPEEEIREINNDHIKNSLAAQLDIDPAYLKPITPEEYMTYTADMDNIMLDDEEEEEEDEDEYGGIED